MTVPTTALYDHPNLDDLVALLEASPREAMTAETGPASAEPLRAPGPQDRSFVSQPPRAVAIIGYSGQFPGAPDLEQFWDNLERGVCAIEPLPADRRTNSVEPSNSWYGGFLAGVDRFDPLFFNMSPADAELMDPQHRLFLSETYRAIEDSGYAPESLSGQAVGVYAGVTGSDRYAEQLPGLRPAQEMLGTADSILAGRVAFFLDLQGPALAVDTACSSSLVAIHLACSGLLSGEVDLALAGGVTLYLSEKAWQEMDHAGMLAADGRCKAFDQSADGFVPGEGVGVVVLKRLDDALACGDPIRAVILGTGVNQDGRTNGLTAPSAKSQAALESQVYRRADVDPASITCVETHGTGTKLGDPIEIEALTRVFRAATDARQFCAVGSVKTNIGHTTAAAGVAGLLKLAGAVNRGKIPPTLHCDVENEHIDFAASPFFVNRELRPWPASGSEPRRAALSSFGFSGTNAHLVMQEPPTRTRMRVQPVMEQLILLSAQTKGALERRVADLARYLGPPHHGDELEDIAFTLARGRTHFSWRTAFVADSVENLRNQLHTWNPPSTPATRGLPTNGNQLPSLHGGDGPPTLSAMRDLYLQGADLPLGQLFPEHSGHRIPLPTYPFERDRCWGAEISVAQAPARSTAPTSWHKHIPATDPATSGHFVDGKPTIPGSAVLLAALESMQPRARELTDLVWLRPIHNPPTGTTLRIEQSSTRFTVLGPDETLYAEGRIQDVGPVRARLAPVRTTPQPATDFYELMKQRGVDYRGAFRSIEFIATENDRASAWLAVGAETATPSAGAVDSALQVVGALVPTDGEGLRPASIDRFAVVPPWPARIEVRAQRTAASRFDVEAIDRDTGRLALTANGLALRSVTKPEPEGELRRAVAATKLPMLTPEQWTRAVAERAALNRYAAALCGAIQLPARNDVRPLYQPMLDALAAVAGSAREASTTTLRRQHPKLARRFDLLDHCAAEMPAVLRGEQLATAVLFGDHTDAIKEIYASSATAIATNAALARLIVAAGPKSVLEFGAGTGATTRVVLEEFAACGQRHPRYLFTDISPTLVNAARQTFTVCEFAQFDVTRPAAEQALAGQFDIVFGTNALHVATDCTAALANLRELVRPGGLIILNEATSADEFAIVTFGLTADWWQAAGPGRLAHSPLLTSTGWLACLDAAGFEEAEEWTAGAAFYGESGQSIIIASAAAECQPSLPPGSRDYVRAVLARVLKIEPERIEDEISFASYGVDSLVVLEINRAFEKDLGRLPVTLLFENNSVTKLAEYFEREHAATLDSLLARAGASAPAPAPSAETHSARTQSDPVGEIAIVGVEGRYPLSDDVHSLWENLETGRDAVRAVPDDRWLWQNSTGLRASTAHHREAGYLDNVDCFDPLHFGISPREAVGMDPQQRVFLETAAAALESAGYTQQRLATNAHQVGVFVGVMNSDYERLGADAAVDGIDTTAHSAHWSIANRVSFALNLEGPSLAVDTACSSSLSAVHLACESLRRGECRVAVAGGVNLILHPHHLEELSGAGMLSATDRCRAFGANADGFAVGEGVGAVVLKPMSHAVADGDTIWAVIVGSAINSGGRTAGYTVPNPNAQASVVGRAIGQAGLDPATITYVEAHGTGTALGDPIEIAGLTQVFGKHSRPIAIGSAKSNFGHLESAAGILALTKTILQIRNRVLAPTLHANPPNPLIDWDTSPFDLVQARTPWPGPRRSCVSSFGAGGANAHVILDEPPALAPRPADTGALHLFVLSARRPDRLMASRDRLIAFLERHPETPLADLAWTLQAGREVYEERIAVTASTVAELIANLGNAPIPSGPPPAPPASLEDALGHRDLPVVARYWLNGERVDWARLYGDSQRRWIPAPTYPYARERYWIPCGHDPRAAAPRALDWVYAPRWRDQPLSACPRTPARGKSLVVATREVPVNLWPSEFQACVIDPQDPGQLERQLADSLAETSRIFFVVGVGPVPPDPLDSAAFERVQESGIVSLFRLVKMLRAHGPRSVELAVITQVLADEPGLAPSAAFAALDGFVRSLRREFSEWQVCCFATCPALLREPQHLLDAAAAELAAQDSRPIRRYWNRREVCVIEPVKPASTKSSPWRDGAHYLILGGGGGIGFETAAHLCRNAHARVTLLGRREADANLAHRIDSAIANGGAIQYIRADATNQASLVEAIGNARSRFGPIRGAIHSALVLEDRTIDRMDEQCLRRVLDSKALTSFEFARALATEPLDFLLFYGSAESFAGDAGQSNYSAASTFQDSFAHALRNSSGLPARIVNWGYWGSVGAVSGGFYEEKLTHKGLQSIEVDEGMEVIEAVLSGDEEQVLAVKANRDALERLGCVEVGEAQDFSSRVRRLEQLGRLHLLAALHRAGAKLSTTKALSLADLLRQVGARNLGIKIAQSLLDVLTRAALIERGDSGWIQIADVAQLPSWEDFGLPQHARLLRACLDALPAILSGETSAVDVLFSDANAESVDAMYQGDPINDRYSMAIAEAAARYLVERDDRSRPCRILEIGAGTGATTAAVLAALHRSDEPFEYTYTDVSPAFLRRGQARFDAAGAELRFALLDIERSPESQQFANSEFDLVVATNVLHATRDLSATLGRVRALLRPGGWLLLNEAIEPNDFLALTFGLLPGWWSAEDTDRRYPHSALASRTTWESLLGEAGFEIQSAQSFERIFIARRAANTDARGPAASDVQGSPARSSEELHVVIKSALAETLQVPLERIRRDAMFLDLGMDSLTAIEIARLINLRLGESPATPLTSLDLYNYPSPDALAGHIDEAYSQSPRSSTVKSRVSDPPDDVLFLLNRVADGALENEAAVDKLLESLRL